MKLRGLLASEKILLVVTVVLLSVYLGSHFLAELWQEKIYVLETKIARTEREIRKSNALIQQKDSLEGKYQAYVNEFAQTSSDEKTRSETIADIEGASSGLGLKILELKPQMEKGIEDLYNRYTVSLTLKGSLIEIMQFLENLQKKPHWFSVTQIRLDSDLSAEKDSLKAYLVLERIYM